MMHPFVEGGLQNVWLSNGYRIKETRNGRSIVVHNPQGLKRTICSALCVKSVPLSGAEFRYLCRELQITSAVLCKRLALTESQLQEWESARQVPRHADTFIRIMYAVHLDRPERVQRLDERSVARNQNVYFLLRHTDRGWVLQETLEPPAAVTSITQAGGQDPTLATDRDSLA
ncbi:MAG: hypothetical protein ACTIKR_11285 [Advenella sp.]|uniref:Transcriptional regulator n=1 Tax=Advenella kashmirensis TaxID=310575 RepID=A0A356LE32_9BURK|nr:hypothetical protein [Advenella sp. FME57]HBP28775.1 hypothetical protein [Advenella kashmirensis]